MSPRAVVAFGLPGSDSFPASVGEIGANVAAHALDHFVTVQRNTASGTDSWGNPVAPVFTTHIADVACLAFVRTARSEQGREIIDGDKTVVIEDRRVLVALGTDVTTDDRLGDVTDAAGAVVFAGPLGIEAVDRRVSYLELAVESIG